jgi:outer membrane protein assembly factor BamB
MATSGGVGGETQLVAVKPGDATHGSEATEAWRTNKQTPHVPTPLIYKDWLFLWSDQGIASCLDKVTGDVIWKQRVGGNYFGSPVCVDGKMYCIDLDGNVVVIAASDKYELLGKVSLGQGSKATPAVSKGVMYLRTESKLSSLGG